MNHKETKKKLAEIDVQIPNILDEVAGKIHSKGEFNATVHPDQVKAIVLDMARNWKDVEHEFNIIRNLIEIKDPK